MEYLSAAPAYGRDYKSQKEVKADWEAGKDFELQGLSARMGRYINKADAPKGCTMMIRYKRLTQQCAIKVK